MIFQIVICTLSLLHFFKLRPMPTIAWSKLDGELPKKRMKDLMSPESDYGKSLIIDNVHPEDAGTYECRSQHLFHQMQVTVTGEFHSYCKICFLNDFHY